MTPARVKLYRVEIRDEEGKEWYARVEAATKAAARSRTHSRVCMSGDTITNVEGPYYMDDRARFAHGWVDAAETSPQLGDIIDIDPDGPVYFEPGIDI